MNLEQAALAAVATLSSVIIVLWKMSVSHWQEMSEEMKELRRDREQLYIKLLQKTEEAEQACSTPNCPLRQQPHSP